jgi:hypothetical protein
VVAGVVLLIAVIAIVAFARSGNNSAALAQTRNGLDRYTTDVRSLVQSVTPAAASENAVPNQLSASQAKSLQQQTASWITQLAKAQQIAAGLQAPTLEAQNANILFIQSIQLYAQAARIYGLAPSSGPAVEGRLLASAGDLRNQASGLWQQGINVLDQARSGAQMGPSALRLPTAGAVAPPSQPSPSATGGGKNKKHNGNSNGNGNGNGGGNGSK